MAFLKSLNKTVSAASMWMEPYYHAIAIALALVLSVAFTFSAWHLAQDASESEANIRFEFRSGQIREAIRGRLVDYEQVLRGGVGLYAASESIERNEWRAYVQHLRIEEIYPGIQGLAFVAHVTAAQRSRHESLMRAGGYHQYSIWPDGQREEYAPIAYIEPFAGLNLRALGFDLGSEPVRRTALDRARDAGEPAISARVTLIQETDRDVQAGFLMFAPIYNNALDISTVGRRRAALTGYIYGAFRMNDLMRGILGKLSDVRLEIFDGSPGQDGALLFDSLPTGAAPGFAPGYAVTSTLPVRGRNWTLRVTSLPAFENTVDTQTPRLVTLAGGLISALVLAIIWSLSTLRARALRLARSMTRELRDSRERMALAIEGSNIALFDWDVATGKVVLSERWSRITGRGSEALATTITELEALIHPEELEMVRQQTADLIRGRDPFYHVEHRVRTASGNWCWILSRAKVVERDAAGHAVRVTGTNVDITERKEVERLKNEFIATVSHELRTPLTAIVGSLGLLKELSAGKLEADAAAFVDMAQQNSERLAVLINDILDIEKIESGQMEFRLDPVTVRPLLERAVALNAPYAEKLGVSFALSQPIPDAVVSGDQDRLLQVLTNLMSNAAKYSPAG
ncbi:MAG TPA: CHASE domain-containing protein, partial [Burkholderiales bacterium]|nr:CHASE domain-containing protein [Burkholderiales bacterium]